MLSRPIRTTASDSLRLLHPLVVNRLFSKKTYKILRDLTSQETYSFDEPFLEDKILFIEAINKVIFPLSGPKSIKPFNFEFSRQLLSDSLTNPGKGSRIYLCHIVFNEIINENLRNAYSPLKQNIIIDNICCLIECLHNLSLIVDDFIDGDILRRSKPTIHVVGGIEAVISISYLMTNILYRLIESFPVTYDIKKLISSKLIERSTNAALAVMEEIKWDRDTETIPWDSITEARIKKIYLAKSTDIIKLALDIFSLIFNIKNVSFLFCYEFVSELGIFLQRINDLENFSINKKKDVLNCDRFSDIRKRRLTLINFNLKVLNNQRLRDLRNQAYQKYACPEQILNYYNALLENNIFEEEISSLEDKFSKISFRIKNLPNFSNSAKKQMTFLLKLYHNQLDDFTFM